MCSALSYHKVQLSPSWPTGRSQGEEDDTDKRRTLSDTAIETNKGKTSFEPRVLHHCVFSSFDMCNTVFNVCSGRSVNQFIQI